MDCAEFRRRLGAEPQDHDPAFLAHRDQCADCAVDCKRAQRFERELLGALLVPAPDGLVERMRQVQLAGEQHARVRRRRVGFAIAASLVLLVFAGGVTLRQIDAHSLAALAVAHVVTEPAAMDRTQAVGAAAVSAAFADRGTVLKGPIPADTTYVHRCHLGPDAIVHLVTRDDNQPVVVLYDPQRSLAAARDFERDGWRGREVPLAHGVLVVLSNRSQRPRFVAVAQAWRIAIDGLAGPRLSGR